MPRVAPCSDVRQSVIAAAGRLMERLGYKKMTIDDIAAEVGIGKATLYGYFENKQEVGVAVIESYHQDIRKEWRRIAETPGDARKKLHQMIEFRVLFLFDVASRHRLSIDDSLCQIRPLVIAKRDDYNESEAEILSQVIREGQLSGHFIEVDPLVTARTIGSCTAGLMPMNLSPRELTSKEQVVEKTNQVVELILRGISTESNGPLSGKQ